MLFLDAGRNYRKYGTEVTTQDLIKLFAIILMVIDHIGFVFFPQEMWWRAVGRLCVPIWLFLAGYARSERPQYEFLWLSALLVLTDWYVGEPLFPLNIFITIIASRMFVAYADTLEQDAVTFLILVALAVIFLPSAFFGFEYGSQAFLFALAGYYYRQNCKRWLAPLSLAIAWAIFCIMQGVSFLFTHAQLVFVAVGCAFVCLGLARYRIIPIENTSQNVWAGCVKYTARNSHYVYALHLIAFLLMRKWMQTDAPAIIRWL